MALLQLNDSAIEACLENAPSATTVTCRGPYSEVVGL